MPILVHDYGDNPHIFDDLVPAFADRFRGIAYARRDVEIAMGKSLRLGDPGLRDSIQATDFYLPEPARHDRETSLGC